MDNSFNYEISPNHFSWLRKKHQTVRELAKSKWYQWAYIKAMSAREILILRESVFIGTNLKSILTKRPLFFVSEDIEKLIGTNGNKTIYNEQVINFEADLIEEESLLKLIELIHRNRKGLEQEVLIRKPGR